MGSAENDEERERRLVAELKMRMRGTGYRCVEKDGARNIRYRQLMSVRMKSMESCGKPKIYHSTTGKDEEADMLSSFMLQRVAEEGQRVVAVDGGIK